MLRLSVTPLAAALLLLGACGDSPPSPTMPADRPSFSLYTGPVCSRTDAQFLQQEIGNLFSTAALRKEARDLESAVERACTSTYAASPIHPSQATNAALDYTTFLLEKRTLVSPTGTGFIGTNASLWAYVVRLYRYVGFAIPTNDGVLSRSGFATVCAADQPCVGKSADRDRAISIPKGALVDQNASAVPTATPLRFLLTGYDVKCDQNLTDGDATPAGYGYCVDINVDPKPGYSYRFAHGMGATVDICAANVGAAPFIFNQAADPYTGASQRQGKLGQRSRGTTGAFKTLSYRPAVAGILSSATDCSGASASRKGYFDPTRGLGRFADGVLALLLPKPAFATHGGLGTMPGFADELSVFGPVDGYAFNGDFDGAGDIVGRFPDNKNPQLRLGEWRFTGPSPSVVTVQNDDNPNDLYNKFGQVNQAGGNSGSLVTFGAFLGDVPAVGPSERDPTPTWRARWRIKVLSTRAQNAAFVLRSGDAAVAGNEIARLTFADGSRSQSGAIAFVTPDAPVTKTDSWAQNGWRSFEVTLGWSSATQVAVTFGFVGDANPLTYTLSRSNLQHLRWELEGRDGQTLGLDEVQLERLADATP
jgi:hypothetical protein